MPSVVKYSFTLNVAIETIMLSVAMLNVIMLSVVMQIVMVLFIKLLIIFLVAISITYLGNWMNGNPSKQLCLFDIKITVL